MVKDAKGPTGKKTGPKEGSNQIKHFLNKGNNLKY